jgi:hypothetical protein
MMMGLFSQLQLFVEGELTPEQHNTWYTKYTMRDTYHDSWPTFLNSDISTRSANTWDGDFNMTMFYGCRFLERRHIGIVMPRDLRKAVIPVMEE